jgi:hypothetical protein
MQEPDPRSPTDADRLGRADLKLSSAVRRLRRFWRTIPSAAGMATTDALERRRLDLRGKSEATDVLVLRLPVGTPR